MSMLYAVRDKIAAFMRGRHKAKSAIAPPSLRELAEKAKAEWHLAQAYFQNVRDPELVDYAIDYLATAEKRYNYLLKKIREQ